MQFVLLQSGQTNDDEWIIQIYLRPMRNRQIMEYLIYPRFFNSISILYKGTYCVAFKIYHITKNNTTTYAYPFLNQLPHRVEPDSSYEPPSLHGDGNFSYETEKSHIVYEQEKKQLNSQCIFRLEYEISKSYQTFMSVRLLKRMTSTAKQDKFCVRKVNQINYQTIDTQIFQIKRENLNKYEKLYFRASQFFSSIDIFIGTFNYGFKLYRNKVQLSRLFEGVKLNKSKSTIAAKQQLEGSKSKSLKKDDRQILKNKEISDFSLTIPTYYIELLTMLIEYDRILKQIKQLLKQVKDSEQDAPFQYQSFADLSYVQAQGPRTEQNLKAHYQTIQSDQTLVCILEEKELVRRNIRLLRISFCQLIALQTDKSFNKKIQQSVKVKQTLEQRYFVRQEEQLTTHQETNSESRQEAGQNYFKELKLANQKIKKYPILIFENYQNYREDKIKKYTLTVFVHGYQGNSFDFQKARNYLKKINKYTQILIIESITGEMNQSIESLGKTVGEQVIKHIQNSKIKYEFINFIGFSLGGIIARASFKHLERFQDKFGIFITFSSPHLGISESQNSLVNIGVWYLIKVDKVLNLKELNFQSVKMEESLLMKLAKCQLLSKFRKIIVVCSKNDGFVPLYSTALQTSKCERQIQQLCQKMRQNIQRIQRVEVMFDVQSAGPFDKLTGRRGHIQFLDNDFFLQMFFKYYAPQM